jgi:hypothetical protein
MERTGCVYRCSVGRPCHGIGMLLWYSGSRVRDRRGPVCHVHIRRTHDLHTLDQVRRCIPRPSPHRYPPCRLPPVDSSSLPAVDSPGSTCCRHSVRASVQCSAPPCPHQHHALYTVSPRTSLLQHKLGLHRTISLLRHGQRCYNPRRHIHHQYREQHPPPHRHVEHLGRHVVVLGAVRQRCV